jgi:enoyl-CoA hydratase
MSLIRIETVTPDVVRLWLCRAEKRNALSAALVTDALAAIEEIDSMDIKVAILAGEGAVFCAGADLGGIGSSTDEPTMVDLCERLLTSSAFWVAAVQGPALGAGVALLAVCPMTVVNRETWFSLPELSLGMFPAGVMAYLEHRLGTKCCIEWGLRGSRWPATAPEIQGLVTELVEEEGLESRVLEFATGLAEVPVPTDSARLAWQGAFRTQWARDRRKELIALLD